jgi:hypothetical protein
VTQATLAEPTQVAATGAAPPNSERWSARVFALAVVVALPLILWFGRDHWFYLDEWQILGADGVTSLGYLDGHSGHWITLLRLEYRLNFELWGLRSYLPYQLPAVLGHLAAAVLLRQVIRRCGVRGWIATAVALAFLFFGSGRENMTLGFQISLTGSLICGFAMLLLADGPKSVTRRDWLALAIGVVGLMTSSVFVAVVVGFGMTTLLRRGVRIAAFYALSLGAIYLPWYVAYGRDSAAPIEVNGQTFRFLGSMLWAVFDALVQGGVGALLVVLVGVGLGTAVHRAWRAGIWAEAALPLGFCAAWLTYATLVALGRAQLPHASGAAGRLVHISAALVLPVVAMGIEELARRRTLLGVAALVPLAIGVPRNLDRLSETSILFRASPELASAIAHSPFADDVPANVRPLQDNPFNPPATAGWLARQAETDRIPEPDDPSPALDLQATSRLVLAQSVGASDQPACPTLTDPLAVTLQAGDQIRFAGAIQVAVTEGTQESPPRRFLGNDRSVLLAHAGPVDVIVRGIPGAPARVCRP